MLPNSVLTALCLAAMIGRSCGFTKSSFASSSMQRQLKVPTPTRISSMPDDDYPSDYDADDLQSSTKTVAVDEEEGDAAIRDELKRELILLASVTNRGMCASAEESNLVIDLVTQLEVSIWCY